MKAGSCHVTHNSVVSIVKHFIWYGWIKIENNHNCCTNLLK